MTRLTLRVRMLAVLTIGLLVGVGLVVACGSDDGAGPPICAGSGCDGGTPESSSTDSPSGDSANDGGDRADGDSSVPTTCGDGGAPGTLDESFGDGGIVWLKYPGAAAYSVVAQPDGRILVGGSTSPRNLALVRLLQNGSVDSSFGTNGLVETKVAPTYNQAFNAVAVQSDGKIIAVGAADLGIGRSYDFAVVRYVSDGRIDPSFGDGGVVTTDFGATDDYPRAVVLLPDGRIVVGGNAETNAMPSSGNYVVARYNTDGSLDTTFGGTGKVTIDIRGTVDSPGVLAFLSPDRVVVAGGSGETTSLATPTEMSCSVLTATGMLDPSFADGGKFIASSAGTNAFAVTADALGRIVVAGSNGSDFALLRLTATGQLDSTFGLGGVLTTDFSGGDVATAVLVQEDGKLLVAGESDQASATTATAISLARYLPNGTLDPAFGVGGKTLTVPPANAYYGTSAAAISGCGVVTAGHWAMGPSGFMQNAMGVTRYRR